MGVAAAVLERIPAIQTNGAAEDGGHYTDTNPESKRAVQQAKAMLMT